MTDHPVRLVVQERRRLVRLGLAEILGEVDAIEVVAAVATCEELLALATDHHADAAVFELIDDVHTRELVTVLRAHDRQIRLIGMHDGRRGDLGRLPGVIDIDALVSYGSGIDSIVDVVLGRTMQRPSQVERRLLPSRNVLTPREREVLEQLAAGKTAADCAAALAVRPKTIDNHKQRIFNKLGVQNQAHAVALAHRMGLFSRPPEQEPAPA